MKTAYAERAEPQLAELLDQIRNGSLQAFDRFYASAAPFVMGLSCKWLGDRMEAEDVCHDVLMAVITQPERYDRSRGTVEAWLAVLAKSRCMDRLRKRSRIVLDAESGEHAARMPIVSDTERRVISKLQGEALRTALGELPGAQRQAISEAFFDYRSQSELAAAWQVPIGTVKSRMRYGLSHLRKAMTRLGWAQSEGEGGGRHG